MTDGRADTAANQGAFTMANPTSKDAPTEVRSTGSGPNSQPQYRDATQSVARDKAIDLALQAIDKQFGKGAIMKLGKDPVDREVHVVPTGSLGLDIALGIGG